jgi:glycerol-3-phosphate dehydrogenase
MRGLRGDHVPILRLMVGTTVLSMASKVAVIGAGTWGTTVAALVCHNTATTLWARSQQVAHDISREHVNRRYLPDFAVPRRLAATASLEEALSGADVVVIGVPSHGFRAVLAGGAGAISPGTPVISLTKGVEQDTLKRMTAGEELGKGRQIDDIMSEMSTVAEGVRTSRAAVALGARVGIELPIAEQVAAVVNGEKTAAEVIPALMTREAKPELEGIVTPGGR